MGYPLSRAPTFYLIVFALYSKPLSCPELHIMLLSPAMQPGLSFLRLQCPLGRERIRQIPYHSWASESLCLISTGFLLCPWEPCTLNSIPSIRRASPGVLRPDVFLIHLAMLPKPVFFMSHTCLPVSLTPMVIAVLKNTPAPGPACRDGCQA